VKTETGVPLTVNIPAEAVPQKVRDVEAQIAAGRRTIAATLALFRGSLREWAIEWARAHSKRVAIAQNAHTLSLGRGEIARLKKEVDEHATGPLADAIEKEFTPERYGDAGAASSGQVATVVKRRFETGIRTLCGTLAPVLAGFGYAPEPLAEDEGRPAPRHDEAAEDDRPRYGRQIELSPDLEDMIAQVADAIADVKVAGAKLELFARQGEREKAAKLWENS
jgi:hypothetical protein